MEYTISFKKKIDTSSIDRLQNKINQLYDNSVNNGSFRMKRLQNKINNLHELEVDDYFETLKKIEITQTITPTEIEEEEKDLNMNETIASTEIVNDKTAHWKLVYAVTISASVLWIILAIS